MKTETKVKGYCVKGHDEAGSFSTGLEYTAYKAKKTLERMLASKTYTEKEKKTFKVVRILEVEEEVE